MALDDKDPSNLLGGGEGGEAVRAVEDEEDDLVEEMNKRRDEAKSAREEWLVEAKECFDFVAGDQWSDEDRKALADQMRPAVTFNRCGPVIDVVAGLEVSNRQEVQYLPREMDDSGAGEIWTGAAKWVRDECNAEDEESEAFVDAAICGEGWIETRLDYEYDPDGFIIMQRTDPLNVLPDPSSKRKNYLDAEYVIVETDVSLDWAIGQWPEKEDDLEAQESLQDDDIQGRSTRVAGDQYQAPTQSTGGKGKAKRRATLTEYQYKKREPFFRVQDPQTGTLTELSAEDHAKVQANAASIGMTIESVKQYRCKVWRAFVIGDVLLENKEAPDPNSFTYKAITAKRDRNKRCWYGLVRGMVDPQRWANKWLSQSMHILNSNAKGGVFVEKDAVDRMAEFEKTYSDPRAVTVVQPGALSSGKVQPKSPPVYPQGFADLMTLAINAIRETSGVSVELLGMTDRSQSGVLEYQRKQSGITVLASLFDALRRYRKEQGRNLLYLIENYISDGRLIRIVGQQGAQYLPLTKQKDAAKYDIIVDEAPSSPNQKEKTWQTLQTLLPLLLQAGIPIPPQTLDLLPLPQSFLDAIKKPDPEKEAKQKADEELAQRGKVAGVEKIESEAMRNKAAAAKDMADAQSAGQPDPSQAAKAQNDMARTQNHIALTNAAHENDIQLQRNDQALKVWKTMQDINLKRAAKAAPNGSLG